MQDRSTSENIHFQVNLWKIINFSIVDVDLWRENFLTHAIFIKYSEKLDKKKVDMKIDSILTVMKYEGMQWRKKIQIAMENSKLNKNSPSLQFYVMAEMKI